ncbi:MAG TPA: SpoIIE family protein phosphatase [Thermoleophilaceae bacterium]|nr:SpoIIE family protein phosphatase [Thermoleophilaceae bacterium]
MTSSTLPPPAPSREPNGWSERTSARLVEDVRALLRVDAVAFVTVDGGCGTLQRSAGWFATPELSEALQPLDSRPIDRGRRGLVEAALERARPLLLPRVEAWEAAPDLLAELMDALGEDRAREVWSTFRAASVIAWRLRTAVGNPLGVILLASIDPSQPLDTGDLRSVEVVADLTAMAMERAALLEAEARRARQGLRLKRAAEAVSGSLEPDEVHRRVVDHAASVTGASKALLTRLDSRARELRMAASVDFSLGEQQGRLSLEGGAVGDVARSRTAVLQRRGEVGGPDGRLMREEGIGCFMHAPLELGPRLYGVLSVAHEDPARFDEDDLELLVQLARSSAAAIANAIDFERERRIARALTLGFVPESLPELPGYETGLLYAPAAGEPTGGDLYGVWRLPSGEVALLIGDVAGKGVETAALSAMVRFFVEARSWDEASPAAVLGQANSMLCDRLPSDSFVTAFLGVLSESSLRYASAGHLPPLIASRDELRTLGGNDLPLGVASVARYAESELALADGELLFAYTDGLIEARRSGEVYGHRRLAELVRRRAAEHAPEELVHAIHGEIADWAGGLTDDAVALALRRRA